MKKSTLKTLDTLVTMLIANAHYCNESEVKNSKKDKLFEVLKYAIRKEAPMIMAHWGINAMNIAKTPRQLNYVASEVEYKLRKMLRANENMKRVWLPKN